jgi:hypothetical protein
VSTGDLAGWIAFDHFAIVRGDAATKASAQGLHLIMQAQKGHVPSSCNPRQPCVSGRTCLAPSRSAQPTWRGTESRVLAVVRLVADINRRVGSLSSVVLPLYIALTSIVRISDPCLHMSHVNPCALTR